MEIMSMLMLLPDSRPFRLGLEPDLPVLEESVSRGRSRDGSPRTPSLGPRALLSQRNPSSPVIAKPPPPGLRPAPIEGQPLGRAQPECDSKARRQRCLPERSMTAIGAQVAQGTRGARSRGAVYHGGGLGTLSD